MDILACFAHPDDETVFAGGTFALLAERGARVHYLCATRGEGGEMGDPAVCDRNSLGAVREAELRCAVSSLGGASLTFLGYRDPPVDANAQGQAFDAPYAEMVDRLASHARTCRAAVVITHGTNGEYGHPAHRLLNRAARDAIVSLGFPETLLYTFSASFPGFPRPRLANRDDEAHFVFDIAPTFARKLAAALCHKTQNPLFVRKGSEEAGRRLRVDEVLMPRESLRRAWPSADGSPDDVFAAFLRARMADLIIRELPDKAPGTH
jgi:LmbE family N-acetylglucosaminyl deacetylase